MFSIRWTILALAGLAIRIWLIQISSKNDNYYEGVYSMLTDLDYKVYLDATLYDSPYQRHTYRYSPLLAHMVTPSYQYDQCFGKYLMAVCDFIAAFFLYRIMADRKGVKDQNRTLGVIVSMFPYLNPFLIYITIRGSCEGITMALASAFWYFYIGGDTNGNMNPEERISKGLVQRQPNKIRKYISYVIFGLWVHFRVYPIIFVPLLIMHQYHSVRENKLKHALNFTIEFGLVAGGVFIALAVYFYYLYGYDFLHQTYFYHITRRDNRHSKSIYFYDLYLNYAADELNPSLVRNVLRSVPTLLVILAFTFYFSKKRSLFYCQGIMMIYFVLFNKVITDQYYLWLFTAAILITPEVKSWKQHKMSTSTLWLMTKIFLYSAPTLITWGVLYKQKFQTVQEQYNLFYYWIVNISNLVVQGMMYTTILSEQCSLATDQSVKSLPQNKDKKE